MGQPVTMGALLQCSFGLAPCPLAVIDPSRPLVESRPVATVNDFIPGSNIASFGMCSSTANPAVIAATAAALGTPTPAPCAPVITGPWMPGSVAVTIGGVAALTDSSTATCIWAGQVKIVQPGPVTTSLT